MTECIGCGTSAEFDRVVVRLGDRSQIGVLCLDCEDQATELFEESEDGEEDDCHFCPRSSSYAFPRWNVIALEDDSNELRWLEYNIGESTIRLCDEHIEAIAQRASIAPNTAHEGSPSIL